MGFVAICRAVAGTSSAASDVKHADIIWQPGIVSFDDFGLCFARTDSGQQSILADAVATALADCSIVIAQFGAIAKATPWPNKPNTAQISKAR
jgi:hypothetical protein